MPTTFWYTIVSFFTYIFSLGLSIFFLCNILWLFITSCLLDKTLSGKEFIGMYKVRLITFIISIMIMLSFSVVSRIEVTQYEVTKVKTSEGYTLKVKDLGYEIPITKYSDVIRLDSVNRIYYRDSIEYTPINLRRRDIFTTIYD